MTHKVNSLSRKLLLFSILAVLLAAWSMPQLAAAPSSHKDKAQQSQIQVGYAIITPDVVSNELMVFETFGEHHGGQTTQAGVLPSTMTTHAVLFVNANGRLSRNVGVAIANPDSGPATVDLKLWDDQGVLLADYASLNGPLVVEGGAQIAKYVTELFASEHNVPKDFTGTLDITSDSPIAVIGIRSRGENFSTLPATSLSEPADVPVIAPGIGGPGAIILAHFAAGGGWATEIVIANAGESDVTVRVDLFDQKGDALVVTLNDLMDNVFFGIKVPAHGVVILAPRDANGDSDF